MNKDCSTCIHKEGSCYPSITIFDKNKTCKSYVPDYEGYIAGLEKENAELKVKNAFCEKACEGTTMMYEHLTKAKEIIKKYLAIGVGGKITQNYLDVTKEAKQFVKK